MSTSSTSSEKTRKTTPGLEDRTGKYESPLGKHMQRKVGTYRTLVRISLDQVIFNCRLPVEEFSLARGSQMSVAHFLGAPQCTAVQGGKSVTCLVLCAVRQRLAAHTMNLSRHRLKNSPEHLPWISMCSIHDYAKSN